ncbi:MAG: alkane 1-monooxygenase [Myxococcota bacterium]
MRFALIYLVLGVFAAGMALGGLGPLLVPAVVFGLIPVADGWSGLDTGDPPGRRWLHDALLRLWVPLQLAAIAATVVYARSAPAGSALLAAVALGICTGAGGITIAHELIHRKSKLDRALGEVLMTSVSYPWFCVEHVLGHHRWVATPRDPATSRLGESVYTFVPRSIVGGLVSFLAIERDYAGRRGIRWWSLRDRRTRYAVTTAATWAVITGVGGPTAAGVFAVQAVVAVVLLEVINYIEHYGLLRPTNAAGEVVRVGPEHSWNSNHALTAAFLFNLPRHADHHAYASRPFDELRAWPDAPELPAGYATMVMVALIPPLWFRTMDERVARTRAATA